VLATSSPAQRGDASSAHHVKRCRPAGWSAGHRWCGKSGAVMAKPWWMSAGKGSEAAPQVIGSRSTAHRLSKGRRGSCQVLSRDEAWRPYCGAAGRRPGGTPRLPKGVDPACVRQHCRRDQAATPRSGIVGNDRDDSAAAKLSFRSRQDVLKPPIILNKRAFRKVIFPEVAVRAEGGRRDAARGTGLPHRGIGFRGNA
jgi:hypothetical protein